MRSQYYRSSPQGKMTDALLHGNIPTGRSCSFKLGPALTVARGMGLASLHFFVGDSEGGMSSEPDSRGASLEGHFFGCEPKRDMLLFFESARRIVVLLARHDSATSLRHSVVLTYGAFWLFSDSRAGLALSPRLSAWVCGMWTSLATSAFHCHCPTLPLGRLETYGAGLAACDQRAVRCPRHRNSSRWASNPPS